MDGVKGGRALTSLSNQLLYLHHIWSAASHISRHISLKATPPILPSSIWPSSLFQRVLTSPSHSTSHWSAQFFPSSLALLAPITWNLPLTNTPHSSLAWLWLCDSPECHSSLRWAWMCVFRWLQVRVWVCVCVLSCLDVCETGVIELRGFSVFGGRGEIGIFRFH